MKKTREAAAAVDGIVPLYEAIPPIPAYIIRRDDDIIHNNNNNMPTGFIILNELIKSLTNNSGDGGANYKIDNFGAHALFITRSV